MYGSSAVMFMPTPQIAILPACNFLLDKSNQTQSCD